MLTVSYPECTCADRLLWRRHCLHCSAQKNALSSGRFTLCVWGKVVEWPGSISSLQDFQIIKISSTFNDKIAFWFAQIIDYTLKYLTSVALLGGSKQYCALSSKVYLKLKASDFTLLQKYLPVRNTRHAFCVYLMCVFHTVYQHVYRKIFQQWIPSFFHVA